MKGDMFCVWGVGDGAEGWRVHEETPCGVRAAKRADPGDKRSASAKQAVEGRRMPRAARSPPFFFEGAFPALSSLPPNSETPLVLEVNTFPAQWRRSAGGSGQHTHLGRRDVGDVCQSVNPCKLLARLLQQARVQGH